MWKILAGLLISSQKGFLKNLLVGAGLMLVTSAAMMAAFSVAVSNLKSSYGSISSNVLGIAHIAGIDVAISIILGAIVTRIGLSASKLSIQKSGQ